MVVNDEASLSATQHAVKLHCTLSVHSSIELRELSLYHDGSTINNGIITTIIIGSPADLWSTLPVCVPKRRAYHRIPQRTGIGVNATGDAGDTSTAIFGQPGTKSLISPAKFVKFLLQSHAKRHGS